MSIVLLFFLYAAVISAMLVTGSERLINYNKTEQKSNKKETRVTALL